MYPAEKILLTAGFLGTAATTLADCNLARKRAILADTSEIREATAVGRGVKAQRNTSLLLELVSILFH